MQGGSYTKLIIYVYKHERNYVEIMVLDKDLELILIFNILY